MKPESFTLRLITPCMSGGASAEEKSEIRAPSIRGQLRWWFRTLGGFRSLPGDRISQERIVFGSVTRETGVGSRLLLQVDNCGAMKTEVLSGSTPPAYVLSTPLREKQRVALGEDQEFTLRVGWRGSGYPRSDIAALISVMANIGALGFRSRRGFGALAPVFNQTTPLPPLFAALAKFPAAEAALILRELTVKQPIRDWSECVGLLSNWLQGWRHHGQMDRAWKWDDRQAQRGHWKRIAEEQKTANIEKEGFPYARRDHNEGLAALGHDRPTSNPKTPLGDDNTVFRAALGLPIIQQYSSIADSRDANKQAQKWKREVKWHPEFDRDKAREDRDYKGEGRFASPVLLRPHRDAQGKWHALVIFVDAHKWPDGKPVYLSGQERQVAMVTLPDGTRSPALYEDMKNDNALKPFGG